MATPWETIIKVYRKQLGNISFPTLKEYQENFILFLRSKKFYTDEEMQKVFLENFAMEILQSVINNIATQNKGLIENPSAESRAKFLLILEENIDNLISISGTHTEFCLEFLDYSIDMFKAYSNQIFEKIKRVRFSDYGINISADLLEKNNTSNIFNINN